MSRKFPPGGVSRGWKFTSPFVFTDFQNDPTERAILGPVSGLPIHVQESIMVEELIWVLQGISRQYIWALPLTDSKAERQFGMDESVDVSIKHFVKSMLQSAALFSAISRYVLVQFILVDSCKENFFDVELECIVSFSDLLMKA